MWLSVKKTTRDNQEQTLLVTMQQNMGMVCVQLASQMVKENG